MENVKMTD